jgi:hypothetical protein
MNSIVTLRLIFFVLFLQGQVTLGYTQTNPVQWTFTAKKVADKTYEVRFKVSVGAPWHIYSQFTPEGGPVPTKFTFSKNPLLSLDGRIKEQGKLVEKFEEVFDIRVKYFEGGVEFIQKVKLRANAKTKLTGSIEYMVCNDRECLPPATTKFSIALL